MSRRWATQRQMDHAVPLAPGEFTLSITTLPTPVVIDNKGLETTITVAKNPKQAASSPSAVFRAVGRAKYARSRQHEVIVPPELYRQFERLSSVHRCVLDEHTGFSVTGPVLARR